MNFLRQRASNFELLLQVPHFLETGRNFLRWNQQQLAPTSPRAIRPNRNQILVLNRQVASRTRESRSAGDLNLIWDKPFRRGRKKRRRQQREPHWGRSGGKPTARSHNKNREKNKDTFGERQQLAPLKHLFLFLCNATMVSRHHDVVYMDVNAQDRAPSLLLLQRKLNN